MVALGLSVQPLPAPPSPPPPPSSMEDSGGWPRFSSTLWSCWQRNRGGTSLDMYLCCCCCCCWDVWFPAGEGEEEEEEEGCPLATAVRCFALFPPPTGGACDESPAAAGLGDAGARGPGLGDAEPEEVRGWEDEGLADSGTLIFCSGTF